MVGPVAQPIYIETQADFGSNNPNQVFASQELNTGLYNGNTQFPIPPGASGFAISAAGLFPATDTFMLFGVADVTAGGNEMAFAMDSDGARVPLAANGFVFMRLNGLPPTIYIDNPSETVTGILQVFMIGAVPGSGWVPSTGGGGVFTINNISGLFVGPAVGQNAYICTADTGDVELTLGNGAAYLGQECIIFLQAALGANVLVINPPAGGTINGSPNPITTNTTNAEFRFLAVSSSNWIYAPVGV